MTKEEIYEAINYNGNYNKEVKKKLRLLMKKFHPDLNKEDKETIKILVEVKNELINNKVSYVKRKKQEEKERPAYEEYEEKKEDDFKNISIKALTDKITELVNKITHIEEKRHKLYKEILQEEEKLNSYQKAHNSNKYDINNIKKLSKETKQISIIEKVLFSILGIILILLLFNYNTIKLLLLILIILIILLIFIMKYNYLNNLTDALYDLEIDNLIIKKDIESVNDNLYNLRYKEGILKRDIIHLKDDITFYNNVISKKTNRNRTYRRENQETYQKRK